MSKSNLHNTDTVGRRRKLKDLVYKKVFLHILGWVVFYLFLYNAFSYRFDISVAMLVALVFIINHLIVFYTNYLVLVPSLFNQRKYFTYTLIVIVLIVVFAYLGSTVLFQMFTPEPGTYFRKKYSQAPDEYHIGRFIRGLFRFGPQASTVIVLLVSSIIRFYEDRVIKEKEMNKLLAEKTNAQLKLLRSQINPHFLFNALNNIYSFSVTRSEKTPEAVLKLSNILRYVIYDSDKDLVPVNNEIELLQNYIELQKMKDEDMGDISFTFERSDYRLAPMVLLPVLENAFKHGDVDYDPKGWIKVDLKIDENGKLLYKVANSVAVKPKQKDATSGIGIKNIRERLDLLYKDRYELHYNSEHETFVLELTLELTK